MTSIWKLVEAELSPEMKKKINESTKQAVANKSQQQGQRRSNNSTNNRGPRKTNRYNGAYYPDTKESREYFAKLAKEQIEFIMSADNLCMDTYLRSFMDVEGYVPIAFLCNYPNVAYCGAFYENIITALEESDMFDVDVANETLRLKSKWQMWLMPNGMGGFGLPRYIKHTDYPVDALSESVSMESPVC